MPPSTDMLSGAGSPEPEKGQHPFRILAPLDGSELAARALPIAEFLCRQLHGELHLVSSVPILAATYSDPQGYIPTELYQQIEDDRVHAASKYLDEAATAARDSEGQPPLDVRIHLTHGDPTSRVLDIVSEARIDLIVMTTHGRTGFARFALGSVADRVVRDGAAPVLLIRSFAAPAPASPELPTAQETQTQPVKLERALVPLDGSPQAEAPLFSLVPSLAGTVLHTVTLLRVANRRDGETGKRLCEQYLDGVRRRLTERLQGRECVVNQVVYSGANAAATIISNTAEGAYDFVLMATHGEAGIGRWAFGGVTDRVLRDGQTPLILAHPPHR